MINLFANPVAPSEPISVPKAGEYIRDIPTTLRKIFSSYLGGTLTIGEFKKLAPQGFAGIMAWYCLDISDPLDPKPFLAFESKPGNFSYPETDAAAAAALRPVASDLLIPTRLFDHDFNIPDHVAYIRNHVDTAPIKDRQLPNADVKTCFETYLQSATIKKYQKFGHGYFENNDGYMSAFLNQDGITHIRYYFGFNATMTPHMIRIVLVPVGADGANVMTLPNGSASILIQKSVPPPPY